MPLDPEVSEYLRALATAGIPPRWEQTVPEVREAFRAGQHVAGPAEPVGRIQDMEVQVRDGVVPARLYRPAASGDLPVLLYLHGGGWVVGDLDTMDGPLTALVNRSGCAVFSVGYRLAPEHRHPTPLDDASDALGWLAKHAGELQLDPNQLAIGGDSAGGTLAAAAVLRARDQRWPRLALQLLVYPVMAHSFDTPSWRELGSGYSLTRRDMEWFWQQYLETPEAGEGPEVSPGCERNLSGLPPTLIITAEFDPLSWEGEDFGRRLAEAGVPVRTVRYPGVIHGFFRLASIFPRGRDAIDEVARSIRSVLVDEDLHAFRNERPHVAGAQPPAAPG